MRKILPSIIVAILLIVILCGGESCRTVKIVGKKETSISGNTKETIYRNLISGIPDYEKVSIKCQISLGSLSSRAQVRLINEKFIQFSFQPMLGIELFKIMLASDSIYVVDRMNAVAAVEPTTSFISKLPGGAGILQFQSLLLGAPFVLTGKITEKDYEKFSLITIGDKTILQEQSVNDPELKFILGNSGNIDQTIISDDKGNTLTGTYTHRSTTGTGKSIPGEVEIRLLLPDKSFYVEIRMSEIIYDWDKTFEPDTKISKRYTRISFDEFIKTYIK